MMNTFVLTALVLFPIVGVLAVWTVDWREFKTYEKEKNYWLDYDMSPAEFLEEHSR